MKHRFSHPLRLLPTRRAAIRLPLLVVLLLLMLTLPYLAFGADGEPDFSFGRDGIVTTDITAWDEGNGVAVQADGKILVVGTTGDGIFSHSDLTLVRYNSDGTRDSSFDRDGIVTTTLSPGARAGYGSGMVVQADGRILALGGNHDAVALVRYNSDGTRDNSFDGDGIVTTTLGIDGAYASNMVMQANKILVVGYTGDPSNPLTYGDTDMVLVRYESDGSLDSSFGGDGLVTATLDIDLTSDTAIQADNKILVVGSTGDIPDMFGYGNTEYALVRYNSDGSLDSSFGGDGLVTATLGTCDVRLYAVAVQPNGKILAAGNVQGDVTCDPNSPVVLALVRYNSDGSLDSSFGGDGIVTTNIGTDAAYAADIAMQGDGKVLVAGTAFTIEGPTSRLALVRYNSDGSLDSTLDGDGIITYSVGPISYASVSHMAVQADGKILLTGNGSVEGNTDIALVRYKEIPGYYRPSYNGHQLYLPFIR